MRTCPGSLINASSRPTRPLVPYSSISPLPLAVASRMTDYGMSLFLEDKTGLLTGSEFIDLNDRMRLIYRCTARDPSHTAYMIYNATTSAGASRPLVALDFGPNNQLGTISVGPNNHVEMKKYLSKVSPLGRYLLF